MNVLLGELGVAALGVAEIGVAAVDHHVALVEVRRDLVDHRIGGRAGLDHAHQHPRPGQRADPLPHRLLADDRTLRAMFFDELVHTAGGAVVHDDRNVVVGNIARQVGAHRGQAG